MTVYEQICKRNISSIVLLNKRKVFIGTGSMKRLTKLFILVYLWRQSLLIPYRFRSIPHAYFRKADGVLLLYDISCEKSFLNVKSWIASIRVSLMRSILTLIFAGVHKDDWLLLVRVWLWHKAAAAAQLPTNSISMWPCITISLGKTKFAKSGN